MKITANPPSQQLLALVATLGGKWSGHKALCRCPAHADSTPSLSLRQGDRGLLVTCFAGCAAEDVLRELSRLRPDYARQYAVPLPASTRANVDRLWSDAMAIEGTLAERYLAGRNIVIPLADVRFHPRCPRGAKPDTVFIPALLVAVRSGTHLTAVQRIFLDASARANAKMMLGNPANGAWQNGFPKNGRLAIAEGFETAAAYTAIHDIPCWASLGARRLPMLTLPDGLTELLIAEDNDTEGRAARTRARAAYRKPGLMITNAPPPATCKDWAKHLETR